MKWTRTTLVCIILPSLICAAKETNAKQIQRVLPLNAFKGRSLRYLAISIRLNTSQQQAPANETYNYIEEESLSYSSQSRWYTSSREENNSAAHLGPVVLIYLLVPTVFLCCCLFALTHPRHLGHRNEPQATVSIEMATQAVTLNKTVTRTHQEAVIVASPDGTFDVGISILDTDKENSAVSTNEVSSTT